MDKFSHDLTVALMEETSLLERARVNKWGQRRRTRSTGNLPCAPQPTEKEDSSSSPTDVTKTTNIDGLDMKGITLPALTDSEDDLNLPCKIIFKNSLKLGVLESDSLNENFSPARFFKPNTRRKRKFKRMSMECDISSVAHDSVETVGPSSSNSFGPSCSTTFSTNTGTLRKRGLKLDMNNSSNFFCGKRKRSNRDRYHEHNQVKAHSTSMPRYNYMEEDRMRPRSCSSASKPPSDKLLPLNKGLVSKIEKISQLHTQTVLTSITTNVTETQERNAVEASTFENQQILHQDHKSLRKKRNSRRRTQLQQLQFSVDQHPMDCGELNDFLSSSSLSSSESDDKHTTNGTDREGDDELTDWPGNDMGNGSIDFKFDFKRKLTKKSNLQGKSDCNSQSVMKNDDTVMLERDWSSNILHNESEFRHRQSQPIAIVNKNMDIKRVMCNMESGRINIPFKQIESEMSGETSNPCLPSPPSQFNEIREIRAGCRRIKDERPGFSIKTSVNERLARFLQDPRQMQIRLPDIEIYEHNSLLNLATLYSLTISLDNGCAVLTKTSNTTQSINIDQHGLQSCLLSDFKRRCYENNGVFPKK